MSSIIFAQLVVSIAAGVALSSLMAYAPSARCVRVMPNTPCLVGASAAAYSLGGNATLEDGVYVEKDLFIF